MNSQNIPKGAVQKPDGSIVIPASRRPDGTLRKEKKIKTGYIPPDEAAKYASKGQVFIEKQKAVGVPGANFAVDVSSSGRKSQKEKQTKAKLKEKKPFFTLGEVVIDTKAENSSETETGGKSGMLDPSKELKKLKKLLRQIEDLELKDDLNEEQKKKLERKNEILKRTTELEAKL